jgi:hypothetical protein
MRNAVGAAARLLPFDDPQAQSWAKLQFDLTYMPK